MLKRLWLVFFITYSFALSAQEIVVGKVYDEYLEPFPGALINSIQGKTTSDIDGNFRLSVKSKFPFSIQVSAFGFKTEVIEVISKDQEINVILKENTSLDEVVISASRSPERVIESPVTIVRLGINDIKTGTSTSFYDEVANLKGITSREASYGFKSVNSRGFSSFDNTRFVQLVDGVETSIPALNFSSGNIVGLSELDVKDVEILPGASSALYGANAFNGILLMRSKNPFKYDGISTYFKTGFIEQEQSGSDQFYDVGIRMAHKFNDYFAAKVNLTLYKAEEWHANDASNTTGVGGEIIEGNRNDTPDYDGVNFYGDEATFTFPGIGRVSRTGYAETDLYDYDGYGLKFDGSLHFRPLGNDKFEIVYNSRFSKGNNLYQAANRFSQEDFFVEQHKLEFLGKNFFVRGYFNGNDSGDRTHDVRFLGLALNAKYNDNSTWFGDYSSAYQGLVTRYTPGNDASARAYADRNRLQPGTAAFNKAIDKLVTIPIAEGGAGVKDQTNFYHADANYNFRDIIKWGEIQIGGSYRKFNINSQGTLFTDKNSSIEFDMYGVYSQIQKKFLDDRLKFTGSVRYDKSSNFDGDFSPRIALNYSIQENKILRVSYQTGFRTPSTIEQYFGLRSGPNKFLLGTSRDNIERFAAQVTNIDNSTNTITGTQVFEKAFVRNNGSYTSSSPTPIEPERVASYELGYRSIVNITDTNILELDVNGYYNQYENFVATKTVFVPNYGDVIITDALGNPVDATEFALNSNTTANVQSYGIGVGLNTKLFRTFNFGANYTFSKLIFDQDEDPEFEPGFNTPEHQVKLMFGNENLFKNFGFNINARWQNEFLWQSGFLSGTVDSRTVLDAQINYRIPSLKSRIKIGGTNLGGKEYVVAPGSGLIGSMYYMSWTINN